MTKVPPVDLQKAALSIDALRAKRAVVVEATPPKDIVVALERAASLIDVYKTAKEAGDDEAYVYLDNARSMILGIMGIS